MPNLNSLPIFLSASVPQNLVGTNKAQSMFDLMVALVGWILSSSGTLVFGGHPSITPLIHRVANLVGIESPQIRLFQLNRFRDVVPPEVNDKKVFQTIRWLGAPRNDRSTLTTELGRMRAEMTRTAGAGIFIGGKTGQYSGDKPGIRDEYERFLKYHPKGPVYLVGMFEGESLNIINNPDEKHRSRLNSLQEAEISILQSSNNIDLIASIILRDLQRHAESWKE